MATSSIGTSYDPTSTAEMLAKSYVAARQDILTTQSKRATATASALTSLKSAISTFQTSLLSLTSGKTMLSRSATFNNTAIGTASATAAAAPGSYSFFVEQLASANQVSYAGLTDTAATTGNLGVKLGGALAFNVDLATADTDGNGTMTPRELAAAINGAPGNSAKVSAAVVTIGGATQLILTAQSTGAASTITLDTSAVASAAVQAVLAPGNATQVVAAKDAKVWLGAEATGTLITQASNTFTNIDGVSMTFTKAQVTGDTPVTLTVAADNAGTIANVQKFVDEYNKLKRVVDGLVKPGDLAKDQAAGVFANDGGVRVLQGRLTSMLRQAAPGGETLATYGITAARDGTLSLDTARLTKQLALQPNGLDELVGSVSAGNPTGIAGKLDTYLKAWSNSVNGQIRQRQDANDRLQTTLATRQEEIDKQYGNAYQRYLAQFTQLQNLQNQMASNTNMFDALFGDKSK